MKYGNTILEHFKKGVQQVLKDTSGDSLIHLNNCYPSFSNIGLIEAGPGAGKSYGIVP